MKKTCGLCFYTTHDEDVFKQHMEQIHGWGRPPPPSRSRPLDERTIATGATIAWIAYAALTFWVSIFCSDYLSGERLGSCVTNANAPLIVTMLPVGAAWYAARRHNRGLTSAFAAIFVAGALVHWFVWLPRV